MKVKCLKVCEGIHNPGTIGQWVQTFSPGKEYELPAGMVRELIKDGKMRDSGSPISEDRLAGMTKKEGFRTSRNDNKKAV